jgi:hypothetical protein
MDEKELAVFLDTYYSIEEVIIDVDDTFIFELFN